MSHFSFFLWYGSAWVVNCLHNFIELPASWAQDYWISEWTTTCSDTPYQKLTKCPLFLLRNLGIIDKNIAWLCITDFFPKILSTIAKKIVHNSFNISILNMGERKQIFPIPCMGFFPPEESPIDFSSFTSQASEHRIKNLYTNNS